MKKNLLSLSCLAVAGMLTLGVASCGGEDAKKDSKAPAAAAAKPGTILPNYRYVDLDTILAKYNLAKDYNDEMLRKQNEFEGEMRRHESSIQNAANSMQKKMQNNGYLSEDAFRADQQRIENMQKNAQSKMGAMQQTLATEAEQAQKILNDSIDTFIKEYNAKHGYDAILFKAATLYINPALDITDEVVEGLNARYNKIKK